MADITPMEPRIDSFVESVEEPTTGAKLTRSLASLQTHTPPETPELPHISDLDAKSGVDLPLFPDSPLRDSSRSLSPLIRYISLNDREPATSNLRYHGRCDSQHDPVEPAVYPGILGIRTAQDALDYHRSCVEEQRRWHLELALPTPARSAVGAKRDVTSAQQLSRLNRSGGISKPRSISPRPIPQTVVATPTAASPRKAPAVRKTSAAGRRTPARAKATSEVPSEASHAQSKKHTRNAPTKKASNQDWTEIEDVTPPLSVLDGKTYQISWPGSTRDISDLPDLEHLHPLEIRWASRLRLDPKHYLAIKRLVFREKLAFLRQGKNFTKTAAQQAASVDVNKMSRLHEAFEAVGWFDERHFQQYLQGGAAE